MLKNKNILMFSNTFFNYEVFIVEKLQERGATVDFYNERPSNNLFIKGIIRVKKELLKSSITKYYQKILENVKTKKYDILFLIKGEVIPKFFIEKIIERNPEIQIFYYNYDSFTNNPNVLDILPLFHYKYTFDPDDSKKYNFVFRPLFYCDDYRDLRRKSLGNKKKYTYDVLFIGTAHSDRYIVAEAVKKIISQYGRVAFNYYYMPSKWVYWFKKFFDSSFFKFDYNNLSFTKLSHSQIIELYNKTNCVLDINHPNQEGLTMRTFEALGARKKLITTNPSINKYSFYNESNIMVINREDVKIEDSFFENKFVEYSDQQLYRMSLDGWIDDIFLRNEPFFHLKKS